MATGSFCGLLFYFCRAPCLKRAMTFGRPRDRIGLAFSDCSVANLKPLGIIGWLRALRLADGFTITGASIAGDCERALPSIFVSSLCTLFSRASLDTLRDELGHEDRSTVISSRFLALPQLVQIASAVSFVFCLPSRSFRRSLCLQ
jgi:hypothetical protein